jgi:hypothetical protein
LADRRADKPGDDAVDLNIIGHEPTAARRVRKLIAPFETEYAAPLGLDRFLESAEVLMMFAPP